MMMVEACVPRGGRLLSGWLDRPLCRRYESAVFDVATVRLRDAGGLARRRVRWAFGWLADGECEALGGWMDPAGGAPDPRRLLAGLQARGLERVPTWPDLEQDRCRTRCRSRRSSRPRECACAWSAPSAAMAVSKPRRRY